MARAPFLPPDYDTKYRVPGNLFSSDSNTFIPMSLTGGWFARPAHVTRALFELAETATSEAEYEAGKARILNS